MAQNKTWNIILLIMGVVCMIGGLYAIKVIELNRLLFSMVAAVGIVLLEITVTNLTEIFVYRKYPMEKKKKDIEFYDERNSAIRQKASEKTNQTMLFIYSFIIFTLLFMNADLYILLLMACAMGMHGVLSIIYFNYFEKRM